MHSVYSQDTDQDQESQDTGLQTRLDLWIKKFRATAVGHGLMDNPHISHLANPVPGSGGAAPYDGERIDYELSLIHI